MVLVKEALRQRFVFVVRTALSSNGKTGGFDPPNTGSSPVRAFVRVM